MLGSTPGTREEYGVLCRSTKRVEISSRMSIVSRAALRLSSAGGMATTLWSCGCCYGSSSVFDTLGRSMLGLEGICWRFIESIPCRLAPRRSRLRLGVHTTRFYKVVYTREHRTYWRPRTQSNTCTPIASSSKIYTGHIKIVTRTTFPFLNLSTYGTFSSPHSLPKQRPHSLQEPSQLPRLIQPIQYCANSLLL